MGPHAGLEHLHRGCASAEQSGRGGHPCGAWDLPEGFDAEWRAIGIITIEGDLIDRCEIFDEENIDAALAKFDELSRPVTQLENAATRTWARVVDAINRHDVDGFLAHAAPDSRYEDRRKVLRDEGSARPEVVRAVFEMTTGWRLETEPVAIRGSRLGLTRDTYRA